MYVVIRRYRVDPANVEEIGRRAREGFIPLIARAPGFVGYRIARAENGDLMTTSTFETRDQAEESVRTAGGWVREHLAALRPTPPEVTGAVVRVRHVETGVEPRQGVMRVYRGATNLDEATRRVEADRSCRTARAGPCSSPMAAARAAAARATVSSPGR